PKALLRLWPSGTLAIWARVYFSASAARRGSCSAITKYDTAGGVPVDERDRHNVAVHGVPRAEDTVRDDLPDAGRMRLEGLPVVSRPITPGGLVQLPHQPGGGKGGPGTRVGRQQVPAPRLPLRVGRHLAFDEGEDLALPVGAEDARRAGE